jgi:hypothetical protein
VVADRRLGPEQPGHRLRGVEDAPPPIHDDVDGIRTEPGHRLVDDVG